MEAIFSTAYLAPVQYYARLIKYNEILIEQFDSYQKQTYRNRCVIMGANGLLNLTVPVVKDSGNKTLVKDIRIDYATRWQNNHWRSICSSYNSSPFFEYYEADFAPYYEKHWDYLIDFNLELHSLIEGYINSGTKVELTTSFQHGFAGDDYREAISPKPQRLIYPDTGFNPVAYTQTFGEIHGFVPNLSIIDLLFNLGPGAETILNQSIS